MRRLRAADPPHAAPGSRLRVARAVCAARTACALSAAGCGSGATAPPDARPEAPPATPTVAFANSLVGAPEGGTAVLRLAVAPAPDAPVTLGYTIGTDDDAATDDADSADYAGDPGGTVRIGAGDTVAAIELAINDDHDIEPAREVLNVTLDTPAPAAGYLLGSPDTARIVIEEGVCDRTPRIQEEILGVAGFGHCLEPGPEDLAAIADLELCNRTDWPLCRREATVIPTLRQGDFQGLSRLERLTLAGVGLTELPEAVFSDLHGLETLWLANNRLTRLPERVFSGLSSLGSLSLADNGLTELPPGTFSGLTGLWWLELSGNPVSELPATVFSGLSSLSGLLMVRSDLTDLPPGLFVGLSKLRALDLRANPGTPFGLPVQLVRIDDDDLLAPGPAEVAARVEQGAPYEMEVILFTQGVGPSVDTLDIETGSALSTIVTVMHDTANTEGTRITMRSVSAAPGDFRGIELRSGDPIVLFARPSPERDRQMQGKRK
ncbi:MAG: leucine-rich repeat domain-containing protein [Gemmatimonadota bacterium]|nr:leucine-rich repeat domain-containing protein [Gemmatimonadota bacterium]MDE2866092.1 leucine-rich repeat domain-containing protein [Gemmatimonadota bacterium]